MDCNFSHKRRRDKHDEERKRRRSMERDRPNSFGDRSRRNYDDHRIMDMDMDRSDEGESRRALIPPLPPDNYPRPPPPPPPPSKPDSSPTPKLKYGNLFPG